MDDDELNLLHRMNAAAEKAEKARLKEETAFRHGLVIGACCMAVLGMLIHIA